MTVTVFELFQDAVRVSLLSLLFYIMYAVFDSNKKPKKKYPPGPFGLPIVGFIPFLAKYAHLHFIELGKKYGDVFSVQLGSRFVVVLNTASAIKEAYAKPEFQGRPQHSAFDVLKRPSPFFGNDNRLWKEHRRLFVHTLKDLGFETPKIENLLQEEVSYFINILKSYESKPIDPQILVTPSVSNNISSLIYNERLHYDHPEKITIDRNVAAITRMLGQTAYRIFFPWMRYIPASLMSKDFLELTKARDETKAIFIEKIEKHTDELDAKNERDFIDKYMVEMQSKKEKSINTTLSLEALRGSMGDIFGAGAETTRNGILWIIYTVAAFPEVQKKVQEEITDVLGHERTPQYTDLKVMPYTHSVILEVMRWKTLLPLSILRSTTENACFRGYDVPKGTILMANLWNAHHDPELWSQAEVFKPERFLSEDKLSVLKSNNFLTFSTGKRACPGEGMANMEVFLYLVSILQAFDVSFPRGYRATFEAELTLNYKPQPYLVHFTARHVD